MWKRAGVGHAPVEQKMLFLLIRINRKLTNQQTATQFVNLVIIKLQQLFRLLYPHSPLCGSLLAKSSIRHCSRHCLSAAKTAYINCFYGSIMWNSLSDNILSVNTFNPKRTVKRFFRMIILCWRGVLVILVPDLLTYCLLSWPYIQRKDSGGRLINNVQLT